VDYKRFLVLRVQASAGRILGCTVYTYAKMNLMAEEESLVLKPREPFSDAVLPESADELAKFMDQPLTAIAESITGALAAGPKNWTVMAGHLVQAILKGKLYQQVAQEIKDLREKGKIPDDFADEKKHKYGFKSWVELLNSH